MNAKHLKAIAFVAAMAAPLIGGLLAVEPPSRASTDAFSKNQERFRAAGKAASITVTPTVILGKPFDKVGEAVAMTLERFGMTNLETTSVAFTPPKDADLDAVAAAFAAFVKANPPSADYVLFSEIVATPDRKIREVRAVVANKQGEIIWKDRQGPGDKLFDRTKPREPIQCCMMVAERLRPVLGLELPSSRTAEGGKITARWRRASGLPDDAEAAALEARAKDFKKNAATSTLLIYPVRVEGKFSAENASNVAALVVKSKFANAKSSSDGPRIEPAADVNEQKILWSMAHSLGDAVKKNPPDADYVLFADYIIGPRGVFAVHFAVCNRQGDLVAVDHQNENTSDFKSINPKTRADCDRLLAKRLERVIR